MSDKKEVAVSLEILGITKEELTEKLLEKLQHDCLADLDESLDTRFAKSVKGLIQKAVDAYANQHLETSVKETIDGFMFETTNGYGERKAPPMTLREFVAKRVDEYLREPVNASGKSREEDSYGWNKATTRVSYMISNYLQFTIQDKMKTALAEANKRIVEGIEEAVKIKLGEIAERLECKAIVPR